MSSLIPAVIVPAFIPSPSQGVWHVLGLPIRAYALCILAGIFAGYWLTRRRWVARGGSPTVLSDVMFWAIPFGLVGARIYHVATDAELYFGEGRHPIDALKIWHGGLGIWGAVGFGCLGAYLACRRAKVPFLGFLDAVAPGIALAQIFGRFGNYFNQELFGKPTTRPWGLEIDPAHRPDGFADFATFHPTFLYEAIWNLGVMALILLAGRRFTLGHGRAFFLYVAAYTAGRAWIENMRIDTVNHFLGLRLNVWTSIILFVLAVAALIISARTKPGQEDLSTGPAAGDPAEASDADTPTDADATDAGDTTDAGTTSPATDGPPVTTEPAPAGSTAGEATTAGATTAASTAGGATLVAESTEPGADGARGAEPEPTDAVSEAAADQASGAGSDEATSATVSGASDSASSELDLTGGSGPDEATSPSAVAAGAEAVGVENADPASDVPAAGGELTSTEAGKNEARD